MGTDEETDVVVVFNIELISATDYRRRTYNVTHESRYVYRVAGSYAPTRIVVWSNVNRPNPRDGQPVRYSDFGPRDGGNGQFLDPGNHATDEPVSTYLEPESSVITDSGGNTGTVASGQVFAPTASRPIHNGDHLALAYPDGTVRTVTVRLTNNGHGVAE